MAGKSKLAAGDSFVGTDEVAADPDAAVVVVPPLPSKVPTSSRL